MLSMQETSAIQGGKKPRLHDARNVSVIRWVTKKLLFPFFGRHSAVYRHTVSCFSYLFHYSNHEKVHVIRTIS